MKVDVDSLFKPVGGLTAAEEQLKTAQEEFERLQTSLVAIEPDTWLGRRKRQIMEWYIIDGFNSHLKIQNDWLPDLEIKLTTRVMSRSHALLTLFIPSVGDQSGCRGVNAEFRNHVTINAIRISGFLLGPRVQLCRFDIIHIIRHGDGCHKHANQK